MRVPCVATTKPTEKRQPFPTRPDSPLYDRGGLIGFAQDNQAAALQVKRHKRPRKLWRSMLRPYKEKTAAEGCRLVDLVIV